MTPASAPDRKRSLLGRSGSRRSLLYTLVGVVVLAAVIFIGGALAKVGSDDDQLGRAPVSAESLRLYDKAVSQYESGETTLALETARRALAEDPANDKAGRLIGRISAVKPAAAGGKDDGDDDPPAPDDPDGGQDPAPPEPDPFNDPVADLTTLLPASLQGWQRGTTTSEGADALVPFTPQRTDIPARRALFAIHDRGSAAEAAKYVTAVSQQAFPEDRATVAVDGANAYFGTDGSLLATVTYVRGRYAFEVSITSASGSPESLRDLAVTIARAFPDKPSN